MDVCVLSVGSVVGMKGNAGQCVYSASKAGLEGFTRSLAKEVASRNIRVNLLAPGTLQPHFSPPTWTLSPLSVSQLVFLQFSSSPCPLVPPGFIHTEMTAGLREEEKVRLIPLGRFGEPEEVAHAALFLLESPYITGQVLLVDGGLQLAM